MKKVGTLNRLFNNLKVQFIISLIIVTVITTLLSNTKVNSNENIITTYLEMHGVIKQAIEFEKADKNLIDSAKITIYNSNKKPIEHVYSNKNGVCFFKLPLNNSYTIEISKNGFIPKILNVDTRINETTLKRYHLFFDTEMFEAISELNVSILNNSIADIKYNSKIKNFDYNYEYANDINEKIKKLYYEYYNYKKDVYLIKKHHKKLKSTIK
jgi:hypothetical protein